MISSLISPVSPIRTIASITAPLRYFCRVVLLVAVLSSCFASCQAQSAPSPAATVTLRTGAEELLRHEYAIYGGLRCAVVANHTSLVGETHLVDTLLARGVNVVKIFCSEHGFRGTAAAGEKVGNSTDSRTGLPIISLYGKNKKPTLKQMSDVDCVIFDLQDVGCRFYTYLSTLHYVMEACAECGIPLLVLDRPNPNGRRIDGPVLDTARCRSFVGMHPVPIVYGMTIGEYALMINGQHWISDSCRLIVVPMEGYNRDSVYSLPVPPSPNLRNSHAIALYPSLCWFEGTRVSVGRGTPWPFELIGLDGDTVDLRREPTSDTITLSYLRRMYGHAWNKKTFFLSNNFFDRLAGTPLLRRQIVAGVSDADIRASWQQDINKFKDIRSRYLLYP